MSDGQPPPLESPPLDASGTPNLGVGDSQEANPRREFPCDQCGARLEFHIGQQELKCPYCGFQKELAFGDDEKVEEQDLLSMLDKLSERGAHSDTQLGEMEISCKGCGSTVAFSGQLATTECSFCGLAIHREDAHKAEDRLDVNAVLPFQIEHAAAKKNLREWVKSRWFAPNEFKKRGVEGRFNGIYLPFWTYDAATFCRYTGQRGTNYTVTTGSGNNRRTEIRTRWSSVSGSFDRFFDDVTIAATTHFPRKLLHELEPWPMSKAMPFATEVLAGKQAMAYDVDLKRGFDEAQTVIRSALDHEARRRIGGDKQRISSLDVQYNGLSYKNMLLPVWVLVYRYQDKPYQVVVNACTGEVQGERPWSIIKIALAVIAALIVCGLLLSLRK